jgi:general secretion pathway protein I
MRRQHAFTLIEVLVALAIVAFGLTALFTVTNQTARASTYLREKTLAQWIALNRITEARLVGQPPSDDSMEGEIKYAGQDWRWELKTLKTPVDGIVRLEARARLDGTSENSWPGFAVGFMGNALAPPGTPPRNWLGEPGAQPGQPPSGKPTPTPTPTPGESPPGQPPPPGQQPPPSETPEEDPAQ